MSTLFERETRRLARPVAILPRALLVVCALLLLPIYLFPLWNMTMFAPQYPEGLRLWIYSYKLDGGHDRQDVEEINVLNHYIGMRALTTEDFSEFKWIPFVVGGLGVLFLRAAVLGRLLDVLDVTVMYFYFAAFSLWSFAFKLWSYGHSLGKSAAVKVAPFMPPMFGHKQLANFEVYSYPDAASYALLGVTIVLLAGLLVSWRQTKAPV